MKVAFATNDRKTIAQHTGRAKEFAVYELSAHNVINIEYHENMHEHHDHSHDQHEHAKGQGHSHKEIVNKLVGIDYLYAKHVGKHFKENLAEAAVKYEITNEEEIMNVIEDFFEDETE